MTPNQKQDPEQLIHLWRDKPPTGGDISAGSRFPYKHVFPSGRQALSACLFQIGLRRPNLVAIPEWSSACVISAVGVHATPIPMHEVVNQEINVEGVLLYEQWGWPFPQEALERSFNFFQGSHVILDKVDSPIFNGRGQDLTADGGKSVVEIWSLSKTLGLTGGGLAKVDGELATFAETPGHQQLYELISCRQNDAVTDNILKSHVQAVPESVKTFLEQRDIVEEFEIEAGARRNHLSIVLESEVARRWPAWMSDVYDAGAAPGIVPLLPECSTEELLAKKVEIERRLGLETQVYHFNFSGDPLNPQYKVCLAFPIHGMIDQDSVRLVCEAGV